MASRRIHTNGHNRLLSLIPKAELRRLSSDLETVRLKTRDQIFGFEQPIRFVDFPLTGVMSLVAEADQRPVEVATIGNEGMVGISSFLGATRTSARAFAQIPGESLRLSAAALRRHLSNGGTGLETILRRYTQALMNQISQTVVCNARHPTEQRACRWLLITHDRVGADEFPLTQEFLAQMLGVRRATVTVVAGILQREGLISYVHGRVTIRDRRRLERETCVCYGIVRREYDRLLG